MQITYSEIQRELGRFLGFGRDPDDWDANQALDAADIIRYAEREFYFQAGHIWSFLTPLSSINVGSQSTALPADFLRMVSSFTFDDEGGQPLELTTEFDIRTSDAAAGRPKYYAVRYSDGYHLLVDPEPDTSYTLSYRYLRQPTAISEGNIYHAGGVLHSETFLECVLMCAEKTLNPETGGETGGIHFQRYQGLLQRSVEIDSSLFAGVEDG